jgi:hypothetical protein
MRNTTTPRGNNNRAGSSYAVGCVYNEENVITYLRLLDADAKGVDWREVARVVCILILNMDLGAFKPSDVIL